MSRFTRLQVLDEAIALSMRIWKSLPHTADNLVIKQQFIGILSAHIDTFEIDENKDEADQMTRYWEFIVRAGKVFTVTTENIRKIRAYLSYEIDEIDGYLPDNTDDKVFILYGLINIAMINGLPAKEDLNIPEIEINICNHFARMMGFRDDSVSEMIQGRITMEKGLAV